jgi:branched-chain amino acid transport system substrate-binding protein
VADGLGLPHRLVYRRAVITGGRGGPIRRSFLALAGLAAALLAVPAARAEAISAQEGPIRIVDIVDLAGPGAAASVKWRNGVDLALREINARGGILGRQVVISHVDRAAPAALEAALAQKPYLLLAPTAAGLPETNLPALVGMADESGRPGNLVRLAGDPAADGAKLADYVARVVKPKSVALLWSESAGHRRMREGLLPRLIAARVALAAEPAAAPQQVDFSAAVLRIRNAGADALIALVDEGEAPRLLRELRQQGYDRPVVGGAALVAPPAIAAAGEAARRVRGVVGLAPAAPAPPIRDVVRSYERAYGGAADSNALLGYSALYAIKAVTERAGGPDGDAFIRAIQGARLSAEENPGVLLDVLFDQAGAADRAALVVATRDGQPIVVDILTPGR